MGTGQLEDASTHLKVCHINLHGLDDEPPDVRHEPLAEFAVGGPNLVSDDQFARRALAL
jgi:hypothetical protein